jgi:hypothetical protein
MLEVLFQRMSSAWNNKPSNWNGNVNFGGLMLQGDVHANGDVIISQYFPTIKNLC